MDYYSPLNSMEKNLLHKILFSFFIILLTSTYTLQDQYFINCGSTSSISVNGRTFIGDANSSSFTLSASKSSAVQDPNPSTNSSSLYETARIFRKTSWYEFDIAQNGTYVVRLHFYAFTSQDNLSDAKFDVLASGFSLLSNFNAQKSNSSPVTEEFFLTVGLGKFKIYFSPSGSSSLAFINAIEAFLAPTSPRLFIPDSAPHISPTGHTPTDYQGLLSNMLRVIHRINVGGVTVTPDNDTLGRNWVPDDDYLFFRDAAMNSPFRSALPNYQDSLATKYDAPPPVYNTAKELNSSLPNYFFNITWLFNVNKNATFLVRAHFCDIVSPALGTLMKFNFYVYSKFGQVIDPHNLISQLAVPFYSDFVVDSDESGFMNISIGPSRDSPNETAFLNGLEIMELIKDSGSIPKATTNNLVVIIGSVVGAIALVFILVVIFLFGFKWKKPRPVETFEGHLLPLYGVNTNSRSLERNIHSSPLPDLNLGLKVPFADILFATNNFDDKLIIGEGGFGKVYKGTLPNGTKVAVKRSEPGRGQGFPEFQTEIMVLSKIRHRHLVSLIGYCDERSEMLLVYEFMEKGTLRQHLYNLKGESRTTSVLSWDTRLELCIGAAKGLHYLHSGLDGAIIHRDVKSTNILLDEHYVAKVADFGISRLGPLDQTHISTEVKGSFGYLDPEYYRCLQLTQKSDVYSFGVVLLEMLCARPAIDNSLPREQTNLADWGMSCLTQGELEKLVDPLLVGKINPNSLRKLGETVEKCLQECGVDRPNMVDVLWDLEYALKLQHTPAPRQPHEDSTTDVSWNLSMPVVRRLPSHCIPISDEETPIIDYSDSSYTNSSQVFSQLNIGGAR